MSVPAASFCKLPVPLITPFNVLLAVLVMFSGSFKIKLLLIVHEPVLKRIEPRPPPSSKVMLDPVMLDVKLLSS